MNKLPVMMIVLLFTASAARAVPPEYKVEEVPNPPSKHGTSQIDGMDFLPDGRLAVCLPSGEIFFYDTSKKTWHLFAEGLHNPLGLVAETNDTLVVAQRPELTRVRDTDKDGVADRFEAMSDRFGMSGNYHEFHFTPVRDGEGGYFFALGTGSSGNGIRSIVRGKFDPRGRPGRMHASTPYRGWVMRLTKDGKTVPWSSGHRTPNGLGTDLRGNLFVTDNQGDWVGSSKLFHVKKGRFYGHAISLTWREGFKDEPLKMPVAELDKLRTRAAVVFPHGSMANSPTQVLAIGPKAKFGPFTGQLLVGEMNKARIMRVMLEEVDGELQGACIPFLDGKPLRNGNNRFAWAPDGSLYVGHTKHTWAGNQGIQRVVWSGKVGFHVHSMNLTKTGFRLTFTRPVDKTVAADPATWSFKRYYYEYHRGYGSKQYDVTPVEVKAARVSADGKQVELELAELKAWHIHDLNINKLKSADGRPLANSYLSYTLNRLLENTPPPPTNQIAGGGGKAGGKKGSKKKPKLVKPVSLKNFKGKVYEAEQAGTGGPSTASGNGGFSGKGYVDFGAAGGQWVEWIVEVNKPGSRKIAIRYAVEGGGRPLKLLVNGKPIGDKPLPFADSGGWTNWADQEAEASFKKGKNRIRLESVGAGPNVDHLRVLP